MKVLFDTNVLIDAFTLRDNSYKDSRDLVIRAAKGEIQGYLSAKQITDIYYILRKYVSNEANRRQIIRDIMDTFEIIHTLKSDLRASLTNGIDDYEDAVLEEVARVNMITFIVTNNTRHFAKSKIAIVSPNELNTLLSVGDN